MQYIKKLEYFLGPENEYASFNIDIFDELYQQQDITALFQPVDFFDKAYTEFLFFYHHSSNYLEIVNHFKDLPYDTSRSYYILYYLSKLLAIEYADKESRGLIFRHDEIVLKGVTFVQQLFKKLDDQLEQTNHRVPRYQRDRQLWQYPAWNKSDFIRNQSSYRHTLTLYDYSEDDFIVERHPYYNVSKGKIICARFTPIEYFGLLTYDIAIPQAKDEPDLNKRIELLRKIRSDVQTHSVDLITTNIIAKQYKGFFDFSEILQHVDVYIENIESSLRLKALNNVTIDESKPFDFNNEFAAIKQAENMFWKGLPMAAVIEHFKVFIEKKNKNGDPYLSNESFVIFLKKAFLNDTEQPKQKINCAIGEKGFVIKRFYQLFELAVTRYGHPNRKQSFIDLFTNCFDNWDAATVATFFKPNKVKEEWQ